MRMRSRAVHVVAGLAVAAFAFVGSPPEALGQHHGGDHGYGHGHGSYGPGYGGYGYGGYGHGYRGYRGHGYRSSYGDVRIEVSPQASRGEAQVYVDGHHVGTVDDFDGRFQRLYLDPGAYDIEIRLSGYRSLRRQVLVSPGNTYNIRHRMETLQAGELSAAAASDEPARRDDAAPAGGTDPGGIAGASDAGYGNLARSGGSAGADYGAVRIDLASDEDRAQVYVDGAHAGTADDFDGTTPLWLAPGTYELEIRLDGHRSFRRGILVTPGNTYELHHRMEPDPGGSPPR